MLGCLCELKGHLKSWREADPEFKPLSNLSSGSPCPRACTERRGQSTVLPVSMDLAYGRLFDEFALSGWWSAGVD